jgi:hypothetical protein
MSWTVIAHPSFDADLFAFDAEVRAGVLAASRLLEKNGPFLGRPHVDTLKGATGANLKELRFSVRGEPWLAFVFDPSRQAILLVAGSKAGISGALFYKRLIKLAEKRYRSHISDMG